MTTRHYILPVVLLTINGMVNAQSVSTLMGARNAGMGHTSATLSDEWSLHNNVGTLANHRYTSVAVAYELGSALPGGNRLAATVAIPLGKGAIGAGIFKFGDELYNEQVISIGYGNRLGLAALGVKINYIQYRAEGFNTKSLISITFGGVAQITPKFSIGAYANNINQPIISNIDDERLPTILALGLQFKVNKKLILVAEVEKDLQYDPIIKGGIAYKVFKKMEIRAGFNINPNAIFAGIGYQLWRLHIGYAVQYNFELSTRHQASINYRISRSKKL